VQVVRNRIALFHLVGLPHHSCESRIMDRWCILASPSYLRETVRSPGPGALRVRKPFMSPKSPSDILLENLPLLERIVGNVCRGRGINAAETEEFSGFVKLRLVENDYAIIRAFKERSAFGTYLTTVVSRLLNDHRNREWGKWHDSAEAKRLGKLAIDLERLIVRDLRSLDDALAILSPEHPGITRTTLEDIVARFPKRHRRKMIPLDEQPDSAMLTEPDDSAASAELGERISRVVTHFVRELPKEDQLLFQLRFGAQMPVPQIAVVRGQDTQSLYRRLRNHLGGLRTALESAGISAHDVARLIGSDAAILDFQLKDDGVRPSKDVGPGVTPEEDE
jgi:RNA polymerase sigma factor (sigma-70 family)